MRTHSAFKVLTLVVLLITILPILLLAPKVPTIRSLVAGSSTSSSSFSAPLQRSPLEPADALRKRREEMERLDRASVYGLESNLYTRDGQPAPDKNFTLVISEGTISPDGYPRMGFLINGLYPAETLIWDEEDDVEIVVQNNSTVAFTIHWHGIHQIGTPEMDGVPGVSQWNIYSGGSFTYRFKLKNQYGGYWYHSHERGYYADGIRGTIYVRPRRDRQKPWSLIRNDTQTIDQLEKAEEDFNVLLMSDHWHIGHSEMLMVVHQTGVPPACFDSLLLNGRGRQYCPWNYTAIAHPAQLSLLKNFSSTNPDGFTSKGCISLVPAKPGYTVKSVLDTYYGGPCQNTSAPLTVINAGKALQQGRKWINLQIEDGATNWYYGISVDGHQMWIVAVDGNYIQPMLVDVTQVTIGSRLSVMIELDESKSNKLWPIRLTGRRALQAIEGHAFLSYDPNATETYNPTIEEDFTYVVDRNATSAHIPVSGFLDPKQTSTKLWQQNLSFPLDGSIKVPQVSNLTLHAVASQGSLNVWQVASQPLDTARLADERPMLFNVTEGGSIDNSMTPYSVATMGTVVDIVMENNLFSIVGGPNSPHPFHLHSRRFWVIGAGTGPFGYDDVQQAIQQGRASSFNLENPPLRDGFDINDNAWVVIRYVVDHPTANVLHCHIDDHAIEGMMAVVLEGLETLLPKNGSLNTNFSDQVKQRPSAWKSTVDDELGSVLEGSWSSGIASSKYPFPDPTETLNPWGDPRPLASSIQDFASSNSVQRSISSASASAASASASVAAADQQTFSARNLVPFRPTHILLPTPS
ncbi:hypothetical protein IE53DRAFT_409831 [Violaceomyces palustris]|uniref:Uncharacterized protein n=1 Tax=Violaceomyces palustris TaxID=1673888 RepID=A0ACD0P1K5_9BASI|nr:hypothetical protein IE53DRAFT_409831 [Violaceomyces palustris]